MRLGIDIGGTCTDFVLEQEGQLRCLKSQTTVSAPSLGVLNGIEALSKQLGLSVLEFVSQIESIVHGTTIATNALITGEIARTALLTTQGHPDVLVFREAGRMGLPTFDHSIQYPSPFIPRNLTFEVEERIDESGNIKIPVNEAQVRQQLKAVGDAKIDAIAVCLLWSNVNPTHEKIVCSLIEELLPEVYCSLSHEVNPRIREYRRASSTSIDASLKPIVTSYLEELKRSLDSRGFTGSLWLSTSLGAVSPAENTPPIQLVRSGPSLGPAAATHFLSKIESSPTALLIDVGGTSLDASLILGGRPVQTSETWIGLPYLGHMTGFPSVDIHSLALGGGSILELDNRIIRIGPTSAGSDPGPACFGRGGHSATVVDAAVVLGYLDPSRFIEQPLEKTYKLASDAMQESLANGLNVSVDRAAYAVFQVFSEEAALEIESMALEAGIDLRGLSLVATGGAAGLVALALARRLKMSSVFFPITAPVNCAAGAVLADVRREFSVSQMVSTDAYEQSKVRPIVSYLEDKCSNFAIEFNVAPQMIGIEYSVEARYLGQSWELKVPVLKEDFENQDALKKKFHQAHDQHHHYYDDHSPIEILSWNAVGVIRADIESPRLTESTPVMLSQEQRQRSVCLDGVAQSPVNVITDYELAKSTGIFGPAIIECANMTVVADYGTEVSFDDGKGIFINIT